MGLMDKVKQVAGEMGEVAKKGASQVQTKVEQTQLRRKADDAAKRLGYLIYRERTGGAAAGTEVDPLVAEIKDAEEQIAAAEAAAAASGETTAQTTAQTTAETTAQTTAQTTATTGVQGTELPTPASQQAAEEATGE